MIGVCALGFVPFAFVDGDHFPSVASDAAVGEEVGRVGENEVNGIIGDFFEEFEAVAVVEANVVSWRWAWTRCLGSSNTGAGRPAGREIINGDR